MDGSCARAHMMTFCFFVGRVQAHNDAFQANKSIQGQAFEGQTPDKAVTTHYNPSAMLY